MGNKIAIILALVLGFMAVFLVKRHLETTKAAFVGDKVQVVCARQKIEKGSEIREDMLGPRTLPLRFLQGSGAYTTWKNRNTLLGGTANFEIQTGEFVHERMLQIGRNIDDTEGIYVKEGLRAYSISASGENAVSGLLIIGDHIDIMGTFLILGGETGLQGVRTRKARTMFLMQDVVIKALDQTTSGRIKEGSYGQLTFELQPMECLVLEFAQNTGKIKLVKRNPNDHFTKFNPDQRIEVHKENLMDFIKIASQQRANRNKEDIGG